MAGEALEFASLGEALRYHAPAIAPVAPLMAAPLAAFVRREAAYIIVVLSAVISACASLYLLHETVQGGVISYHMGGWEPPWGIEVRVDALNALIISLVSLMAVIALIYAPRSLHAERIGAEKSLFYAAFALTLSGLVGVAITGDAFNMFVFLEISSLGTYTIVALGAARDRRALPATFNYLIMGTIGATFFVIGVGFLYMATGTLNMADIAGKLEGQYDNRVVHAALAFIVVGLGLKAAVFPLHQWLPGAYAQAPSVVTVFLASTATKVAFYALIRMLYSVFDPSTELVASVLAYFIAPLGAAGMLVGSAMAIGQSDVKRLLAYSSVAQVGYFLLGLGAATSLSISASMWHLSNHALMKAALFMAVGVVVWKTGGSRLRDFEGAGRTMPFTMAAIVIGGLSLIGAPLTVGFVSKIALLGAMIERDWIWAALLIGVSSLLALFYVGRLVEAAYLRAPRADAAFRLAAPPLSMTIPLWVLALANIYFGVQSEWIAEISAAAAQAALPPVGSAP